MHEVAKFFVLILSCLFERSAASTCYSDVCHDTAALSTASSTSSSTSAPDFQCWLTSIESEEDCTGLRFENLNHVPPKESTANFQLSAYSNDKEKTTAFNLSITDINFQRLVMRYQNLANESLSFCSRVELSDNGSYSVYREMYISCPFFNNTYEDSAYRLEYLVAGKDYEYSKKLVFKVPHHRFIGEDINIFMYTPFIYVDVSDTSVLSVYIQPLPERYNVTEYKIWLFNNDTNHGMSVNVSSVNKTEHLRHDFTVHNGLYYFVVSALHPDCGEYGCANSTSPFISIKEVSHRILIMIISIIWIPPVILYALYHVYKLYKKRDMMRGNEKQKTCLLVYSPAPKAHVNVLVNLTKYLKGCNINAMIDVVDIPVIHNKDPEAWCNLAFHSADIILIATSPLPRKTEISNVYQTTDHHIFRLMKEDCLRRNKKYYVIQFPYCKPEDVPEEGQQFKVLYMPNDLIKLVKIIHGSDYVHFFGASNKEFVDSIKAAELEILDVETVGQKHTEETEGLLSSAEVQKTGNLHLDVVSVPQAYTAPLESINLFIDAGEGEGEGSDCKSDDK